MNKRVKILMVVIFSVLLISANFNLFSGEKEFTKCPGCGHNVEKGKGVTADHHGGKLTFCHEKCKDAFVKKTAECNHKATYKCPMEKCNFSSDKDGKCPKCGMALEKVEKKAVYKCTTEGCKFTSDKEGKCPSCKTDLKKECCSTHTAHKGHKTHKTKSGCTKK